MSMDNFANGLERARIAVAEFAKAVRNYNEMVTRCYLKYNSKLPCGMARTKRLKKKRAKIIFAWYCDYHEKKQTRIT